MTELGLVDLYSGLCLVSPSIPDLYGVYYVAGGKGCAVHCSIDGGNSAGLESAFGAGEEQWSCSDPMSVSKLRRSYLQAASEEVGRHPLDGTVIE